MLPFLILTGQLGIGHTHSRLQPTLILKSDKITDFACGGNHVLLLESGRLIVFGSNKYGEIGMDDTNYEVNPFCLFKDPRPHTIACGFSHSMVLFSGGELIGFGRNENVLSLKFSSLFFYCFLFWKFRVLNFFATSLFHLLFTSPILFHKRTTWNWKR